MRQTYIDADQRGTNVQAGSVGVRHPFLVDRYQSVQALDQLFAIECRQAGPFGRQIHAIHVHIRTEYSDAAINASVCLHAFEQLENNGIEKEGKIENYSI